MTLKIIPATDPMPVANIVLTLYAAPGLGKSTLGFTAERPLMLDFDKGAYRACNRGDAVTVTRWSDVEAMTAEDLEPYATIIIDTAGRALDVLGVDIIAKNPKAGAAAISRCKATANSRGASPSGSHSFALRARTWFSSATWTSSATATTRRSASTRREARRMKSTSPAMRCAGFRFSPTAPAS